MPKKAAGLAVRKVDTMKTPGLFADGGGLYLQITATGAKTGSTAFNSMAGAGTWGWGHCQQ